VRLAAFQSGSWRFLRSQPSLKRAVAGRRIYDLQHSIPQALTLDGSRRLATRKSDRHGHLLAVDAA
jgi:hypothetical protein